LKISRLSMRYLPKVSLLPSPVISELN